MTEFSEEILNAFILEHRLTKVAVELCWLMLLYFLPKQTSAMFHLLRNVLFV